MDLLRSCYRSKQRLFNDRPDVLVDGQWYFCKAGALPIPFIHSFGSSQWDPSTIRERPRLGEVGRRGAWVSGLPEIGLYGDHFCGDADVWLNGVPYSERGNLPVDEDGVPLCCSRVGFLRAELEVSATLSPRPELRAELLVSAVIDTGVYIFACVEVGCRLGTEMPLTADLWVFAFLGGFPALNAALEIGSVFGTRYVLNAELEVAADMPSGFRLAAEIEVSAEMTVEVPIEIVTDCCPSSPGIIHLHVEGFVNFPWVNGDFTLTYAGGFGVWYLNWLDVDGYFNTWTFLCSGLGEPPFASWFLNLSTSSCFNDVDDMGNGYTDLSAGGSCNPWRVPIMLTVFFNHCDTAAPESRIVWLTRET